MIVAIFYTHCCKDNYYNVYDADYDDFYKLTDIVNNHEDCEEGIYWIERNYGEVDPNIDAIIRRLNLKETHMVEHRNDDLFVQEIHSIHGYDVVCLREVVC
jgi:hypothetical protein